MKIGVPRETQSGETRVSLTPGTLPPLLADGHEILVQTGAGLAAHFADGQYARAGARIVDSASALYNQADAVLAVQPPPLLAASADSGAIAASDLPRDGCVYIGLLSPLTQPDLVMACARRHLTSYALELIPRISRAQSMDALTAMATVAGYKAVLMAADRLDSMFPLLMTAAGTIAPATVLVLGAGVAGLQAIATAHRLGARVIAFDPRPAVREQVQSLGATFVEMETPETTEKVETAGGYAREQSEGYLHAEQAAIAEHLPQMDVVICTAQVFGKRAPLLMTAEMVERMRPGAVIVDLAADQGGNCALTQSGQETDHGGVRIIGAGNVPALVAADASRLYAHTMVSLFRYLYPARGTPPDQSDEIVRAACVTRDGQIVNEAVREAVGEAVHAVLPLGAREAGATA